MRLCDSQTMFYVIDPIHFFVRFGSLDRFSYVNVLIFLIQLLEIKINRLDVNNVYFLTQIVFRKMN